jgi:hypothetical protein
VDRYRKGGLRDLRESAFIGVLRRRGWGNGAIAWELVDWEAVEQDESPEMARRESYEAAHKRVARAAL